MDQQIISSLDVLGKIDHGAKSLLFCIKSESEKTFDNGIKDGVNGWY